MPTLFLPAAHTDTDVALASEIAGAVGSDALYVTWTHDEGPGLPPEIEAVMYGGRRPGPISPFAEVVAAMVQGISAMWNAIRYPPEARPQLPAPPDDRDAARPAAEEPLA